MYASRFFRLRLFARSIPQNILRVPTVFTIAFQRPVLSIGIISFIFMVGKSCGANAAAIAAHPLAQLAGLPCAGAVVAERGVRRVERVDEVLCSGHIEIAGNLDSVAVERAPYPTVDHKCAVFSHRRVDK